MTRLNDASIVAAYLDCEQACVRKGLTAKTNKTNFVARDSRGVKQIEAHEVTEFRRLIRAWRSKSVRRSAAILPFSRGPIKAGRTIHGEFDDAGMKLLEQHMAIPGVKRPYSLVDNEDAKGRIPGDKGYKGPGL